MTEAAHSRWFPIASSGDLVFRHVFHAKLLGRELAVWRADDGFVNVWENRCLHRGVRLSIGINDGHELRCQYHGWRYANRTAGCTYIPAHPADAPARSICNNTYPAREGYGLVWSGGDGDLPVFEGFQQSTVLRPIPVHATAAMVFAGLRDYTFSKKPQSVVQEEDSVIITVADGVVLRLFVQPCDSGHSVIRGLINQTLEGEQRLDILAQHSFLLQELRDDLEAEAAKQNAPAPMNPTLSRISPELAGLPEQTSGERAAEARVHVTAKEMTAKDIVCLRLEGIRGQLPTFQPGAHIDLHLPNGLIRQYSLTNAPGQTDHYSIGVKRETDSQGGSVCVHDDVRIGDVLAVSAPRNNFPLRRDALHTTFIAGGIGITPLLAMARALKIQRLDFALHYFVQSMDHAGFQTEMQGFDSALQIHSALTPEKTRAMLKEILADPGHARHAYICGPAAMIEAALEVAEHQGWPDDHVHFEYFKNTTEIDHNSSFEIDLARSAMTLHVPAGKTILQVLRENNIPVPSSCAQGACGTCRCDVLQGQIKHQDVYLSATEKAAQDTIITCVSRAASPRLVLDI